MKQYLEESLEINVIQKHGEATNVGTKISGTTSIKYKRPIIDTNEFLEESEFVNYAAISIENKDSKKFEWKIEYKAVK